MITQRIKVEKDASGNPTGNLVKDDGSLFTAWGHNYDNINILDVGAYGEIIENVWEDNLNSQIPIFTITNVAWVWTGIDTNYTITLTLAESFDGDEFITSPEEEEEEQYIVIEGVPKINATAAIGGGSVLIDINGASTDQNINRTIVSNANAENKTIQFDQDLNQFVNNGSASVSNGILGSPSIEFDLAVLNKIAKSKIIRICLQMSKFMLNDEDYKSAWSNAGGDTVDEPIVQETDQIVSESNVAVEDNTDIVESDINDPYYVNDQQLDNLYKFCDLAAKYDLYVIINGANAWLSADQPNWLAWATEDVRWTAQAAWWKSVATKIGDHSAVAWYSLINEPIDPNNDFIIYQDYNSDEAVFDNGDGTYNIEIPAPDTASAAIVNFLGADPPIIGYDLSFLSSKYGQPGHAIITDKSLTDASSEEESYLSNNCALLQYDNLSYSGAYPTGDEKQYTLTIHNARTTAFGDNEDILTNINENLLNPEKYAFMHISFIDKDFDIDDVSIKLTKENNLALIDFASTTQKFLGQVISSNYDNQSAFIGESEYTSFSSNLDALFSQNQTSGQMKALDYGTTRAILSSINGYKQILKNYSLSSGNKNKLNFVHFGHADFINYGLNSAKTRGGYNSKFFIQSLRFVLSRLRSKKITKFTSGSAQSLPEEEIENYFYRRFTSSATVNFSTGNDFAGETIGIGFMVEPNANATAKITIGERTYTQSLISGTDVLSSSDPLPIVKRIENIPPGNQTVTIELTINSGSACLDYWQLESFSPAPIIVSSIDNNALPSTLDTNFSNPVIEWNQKIAELIYGEFIDDLVYFVDINNPNISPKLTSSDYDGSNENAYLNNIGKDDLANIYQRFIQSKSLLPTQGLTESRRTIPKNGGTSITNSSYIVLEFNDNNWSKFPGFQPGATIEIKRPDGTLINLSNKNPKIEGFVTSKTNNSEPTVVSKKTPYLKIKFDSSTTITVQDQSTIIAKYKNKTATISGNTVTYICQDPHGLSIKDKINIFGVLPSSLNGNFEVSAVLNDYTFEVKTPSPVTGDTSVTEESGFRTIRLKPSTSYSIRLNNSESIPDNVFFITGSSITLNQNGYYPIKLLNVKKEDIKDSPDNDFESCVLTNNTHWLGSPYFNQDRYYNAHITLTPFTGTGRTKQSIARDWIEKMKSAIREVDAYTPISVPNVLFSESGFSPDNLLNKNDVSKNLIDIVTPHQYMVFGTTLVPIDTLVNNLKICADYGVPVVLEEGATTFNGEGNDDYFERAKEYLLKSKRYLAGALNNYQGYYSLNEYGWVPWSNDYTNYQKLFDALTPFMDDAPINDPISDVILSDYGPTGKNDINVNKRQIIGKRTLSPISDLASGFTGFDNFNDVNNALREADNSYTLRKQLIKLNSTISSSSYVYLNQNSVKSNYTTRIGLNGFKLGSNQEIVSMNTVANLQLADYPMLSRNYIPTNYSPSPVASSNGWAMYNPSGTYNIVSIMNISNSTTLRLPLNINDASIEVNDINKFINTTGVIKINDEYIKYAFKINGNGSTGSLGLSPNPNDPSQAGRGFRNTRPNKTYAAGTEINGNMPNTAYGVQTLDISTSTARISSATSTSSTYTYAAINLFAIGQSVTITGFTGAFAAYNVTNAVITARTATSFTVAGTANPGSVTQNATATKNMVQIHWPLSTPSAIPSGRQITKLTVYVCVYIDPSSSDLNSTRQTVSTNNTSISAGSRTARLEFLNSTFPARFVQGASVSGTGIPAGATIEGFSTSSTGSILSTPGTDRKFLVIQFPPAANSSQIGQITVTAILGRQCAKITITDRTNFFKWYSISYKGNWISSSVTYSAGDFVYYNDAIWKAKSTGQGTPGVDSIWIRYSESNDYIDSNGGFVWIPITLYKIGIFGDWFDKVLQMANTYTANNVTYRLDPTNLGILVENSNTITTESNQYIKIAKVYADSYTNGYLEPQGATILQTQFWKTGDFVEQNPNNRINFTAPLTDNINDQWLTSGDYLNLTLNNVVNFTDANSLNNNTEIRFVIPINGIPLSYGTGPQNKPRINSAYVEVKLKETLARKGTSIVSIG